MARHRYKSYKSRSSRSSRGRGKGRNKGIDKRWAVLLLIVIAAGLFILKQTRKNDTNQSQINGEETVNTLDDFLESIERVNTDDKITSTKNDSQDSDDKGQINVDVNNEHADPVKIDPTVIVSGGDGISDAEANKLLATVADDIDNGKIIDARNKLKKILLDIPISNIQRDRIKAWLAQLSREWLFNNESLEGDTLTGYYKVKSGDYFSVIARNYKVPSEILMQINGIKDATKLRAGGNIKIVKGPFRAVVHLSKFKMDLFLQDQYVKTYDIGIGKPGRETPTGKWRLVRGGKNPNQPPWPDPENNNKLIMADDPKYPLGARWIPIECTEGEGLGRTGFALHGTNDPGSIGTKCSRGCIRLHDRDIIEVYKVLSSYHSTVEILP